MKTIDDVLNTASRLAVAGQEALVDVGPVDVGLDGETISALAAARRDLLYGIPLRCHVAGRVSRFEAQLLASAGAVSVELAALDEDVDDWQTTFLQLVASVLRLHEVGIATEWSLPEGALTQPALTEITQLIPALTHVPPPAASGDPSGEHVDAVIGDWRESHTPWRLTYARGPGFLRIYDRRAQRQRPAVIVLHGRQADVFLAFEEECTVEDAAEVAPEIPPNRLAGFLSALVANRLIARGSGSSHLTLPIRRKVEERWIERAYV